MNDGREDPRVLVIYYSYAGHTRLLAEQVAQAACADLEELHGVGEPVGMSASHWFWSLWHLLPGHRPALAEQRYDPAAYDLLLIGSPVWMGSFTPAVCSYLTTAPLAGRTVALFCSYNSSPGPSLANAVRLLPSSTTVLGTAGFANPDRRGAGSLHIRVQRWVHGLCLAYGGRGRAL